MRRYAARVECVCANCGSISLKKPCDIKRGGGKFCSVACRIAFKRPAKFIGKCENCGIEIGPDARGRTRKYCSRECVGQAVGRNGEARIRNPPVERLCKTCGVKFSTYHRSKVFCSQVCAGKHNRGKQVGRGRKDLNHDEIARAFEGAGAVVWDLTSLGGGVPDMCVLYRGEIHAVEVKNPGTAYGRKGLNANQLAFERAIARADCRVHVVRTVDEALAVLGARRGA